MSSVNQEQPTINSPRNIAYTNFNQNITKKVKRPSTLHIYRENNSAKA